MVCMTYVCVYVCVCVCVCMCGGRWVCVDVMYITSNLLLSDTQQYSENNRVLKHPDIRVYKPTYTHLFPLSLH